MKEKKNSPKEALQSEEAFDALITEEALSGDFQEKKRVVEEGPHPTNQDLYNYVWDPQYDENDFRIMRHTAYCGICAKKVLELRGIRNDAEEKLLDWADGNVEIPRPSLDETMPPLEPKIDIYEGLASDFHTYRWAGQQVSAADISEQTHTFRMKEEESSLKLSCLWRPEYGGKPAHIRIKWDARLMSRKEIWLRFIDPETETFRCEKLLGHQRKGNKEFPQNELDFDPSCERWAVGIVLKEVVEYSLEDMPPPVTKEDLLEGHAADYWSPELAGKPMTAADMSEEEHTFTIEEEGEINVTCTWEGGSPNKSAYMRVSWEANISHARELWVQFISRDTERRLFSEIFLGTEPTGAWDFTEDKLGFDPSTQAWDLALVLRTIPSP